MSTKQQSTSPDPASGTGKKKKSKKGLIRAKAREGGNTLRSYMLISEHSDSEKDESESSSLAPYLPRAPSKGNRTSINHYQTEQSQTESSNY